VPCGAHEQRRTKVSSAPSAEIDFYIDAVGLHRWRMIDGNNENVCNGSQGYSTREACEEGFKNVRLEMVANIGREWMVVLKRLGL
jgi:uncharacterized protein YegP (UPF0339 family)